MPTESAVSTEMPGQRALKGHFASTAHRRLEQRWQRVGIGLLCGVIGAALAGVIDTPATVGRAGLVYVFLLAVFRVAGRRTLAQVTTFDLILVLILGDATQQALVGEQGTTATAVVAVATLVLFDIGLSWAKQRWPAVDVVIDGLPIPLVMHGTPHAAQMTAEGVTEDDILSAARERQGLSHMDEVAFAVLEQSGGISIVPRASAPAETTPGRPA
jgi:uncharacterized membrane protein YcaP (DUF421 family)